jgi:uncharacterized protein
MFRVVLDNNVIIAAAHNPTGKPALVLSIALSGKSGLLFLYISQEVLGEYQEVFARDKFKYLNQDHVKTLLSQIKKHATMVKASQSLSVIKIDSADNRFLECALAAEADFLVTGNIKHFPFKKFQHTRIVSPQEFLIILGEAVL